MEIERERLKIERMQIVFRFLGVVGACVTFAWSAWIYFDARKREAETRRIEASKSFLDMQLKLFDEITNLTARLAMTPPAEHKPADVRRFWELYWGQLGMVEYGEVASAMAAFGRLLESGASPVPEPPSQSRLGGASIGIAHAAREELARSWKVEEWRRR